MKEEKKITEQQTEEQTSPQTENPVDVQEKAGATTRRGRRIANTQRTIRNALAQLLVEKPLERLSIKEIAERADVDRKTVYHYYATVEDVLAELERDWVEDFDAFTRRLENERGSDYLLHFFPALAELIADDIDLYSHLMRMGTQSLVIRQLTAFLTEKIRNAFARSYDLEETKCNVAAEFVLAGLLQTFRLYFSTENRKPLKEFSEDLARLVMGGLTAFFAAGEDGTPTVESTPSAPLDDNTLQDNA